MGAAGLCSVSPASWKPAEPQEAGVSVRSLCPPVIVHLLPSPAQALTGLVSSTSETWVTA